MAKKRERVFALTLALLFLVSSLGFTGIIIYQMINQDEAQTEQESIQGGTVGKKLSDFEPVSKVTKLETIDLQEGDGEEVKAGATVTVHYTGALAKDGSVFESSLDSGQPVTFPLEGVIEGWTEGIPGMKVGGTRRLIIPAEQAYGAQSPSPSIPANSDLVFDVQVIAVQ